MEILKKISIFVLGLTLIASNTVVSASAVADGTYDAPVNTYYINQDTGVTDDGGTKNAALGEGMCRSAVDESGTLEIKNGKIYGTVRMLLVSNCSNYTFTVQKTKGDPNSYVEVTPEIVVEDSAADSREYRFELPAADSYIGCAMFVTPMGRAVKFYMNFTPPSQLKEAAASTTKETETPSKSDKSEQSKKEQSAKKEISVQTENAVQQKPVEAATEEVKPQAAAGETKPQGAAENSSAEATGSTEVNAAEQDEVRDTGTGGIDTDESASNEPEPETDSQTKDSRGVVAFIVVLLLAAGVGFFVRRKSKKKG